MLTPLAWEYKNPLFESSGPAPHAFGIYDKVMGAFQLSCKPVNTHIEGLIKTRRLPIQESGKGILVFDEVFVDHGDQHAYMFCCVVDDHFIFATYIVDAKKAISKKGQQELTEVRSALSTIKYIKPAFRGKVLSVRRYNLFMASMAATIDLKNKAMKNGSFIELVVLTANRIDGELRLALILDDQLVNKHDDIDVTILYQGEQDKAVMERQIYKMALDKNIIEQDVFDELEVLYKERNRVVHRYIITDIRTQQVLQIAFKYYQLEEKVNRIVNNLEQKQFELQVGIHASSTAPGSMVDDDFLEKIRFAVRDKHGPVKWEVKDNPGKRNRKG